MGRLRRPRRSTTLRAALVAALLLTAAGVLYGGESGTSDPAPAAASADPGTTGPTRSAPPTPRVPQGQPPEGGVPGRRQIPDGMVGVPVPLGGPAALAVLRPDDRVDLLAVGATGGDPVPVADAAPVLAIDQGAATVLLALTPAQAHQVVAAPTSTRFAVVVHP